ncbi:dockerin type I repeat-containing protein [Ruminococcus sp.]|uniref:dockerin type I repeat-containing protein n=1 Tax=Ruminococcus sp. TaxID=41978 RepID=UPI003F009167
MKKIISVLLCSVLVFTAVMAGVSSVSAASSTASTKRYSIDYSKTITVPNNQIRVYTSNLTEDNCVGNAVFKDEGGNEIIVAVKDCIENYQTVKTGVNKKYKIGINMDSSTSRTNDFFSFSKTGGYYQLIRFNIRDFVEKDFNENGTVTKELWDNVHDYNFTNENGIHKSVLMIISGAAITIAAPDKDGYVEAYMSKNLGDLAMAMTTYGYKSEDHFSIGGGTDYYLYGLSVGDVNKNGNVEIVDVTRIQEYVAGKKELDSLSKRAADVNLDRKIGIKDATEIQKYLAELDN